MKPAPVEDEEALFNPNYGTTVVPGLVLGISEVMIKSDRMRPVRREAVEVAIIPKFAS